MDPHNLNEIIQSVIKLGKLLQKEEKALEIMHNLRQRIENIQNSKNEKMPTVLAIEWIEPFFTAGHWIPEMIELQAGLFFKIESYSETVRAISNPQGIKIIMSGLQFMTSVISIRLECSSVLLIKLIPPASSIIPGIQ